VRAAESRRARRGLLHVALCAELEDSSAAANGQQHSRDIGFASQSSRLSELSPLRPLSHPALAAWLAPWRARGGVCREAPQGCDVSTVCGMSVPLYPVYENERSLCQTNDCTVYCTRVERPPTHVLSPDSLSESGCTTTQVHAHVHAPFLPQHPPPPPKRMQYIALRLVCPAPH